MANPPKNRDRDGSGAVMLTALHVPRRIADHHDRLFGKCDSPGVDRTVHGESGEVVPDLVVRAVASYPKVFGQTDRSELQASASQDVARHEPQSDLLGTA